MLVKSIVPVKKFILENQNQMAEEALWKLAALTYEKDVRAPRAQEGVPTPPWAWKDLRTHFLLHCTDKEISGTMRLRQLQTARFGVTERLMRVTDGEREVDKAGLDALIKARASLDCTIRNTRNTRNTRACADHQGGARRALAHGLERRRRRWQHRHGAQQEAAGRLDRRRCQQVKWGVEGVGGSGRCGGCGGGAYACICVRCGGVHGSVPSRAQRW